VLVAIRENQQRATSTLRRRRYRLAVFVLSATVTALGGALSPSSTTWCRRVVSVAFSGSCWRWW